VDPKDEFIPDEYPNLILDGEKIVELNSKDKKSLENLPDIFLIMLELSNIKITANEIKHLIKNKFIIISLKLSYKKIKVQSTLLNTLKLFINLKKFDLARNDAYGKEIDV